MGRWIVTATLLAAVCGAGDTDVQRAYKDLETYDVDTAGQVARYKAESPLETGFFAPSMTLRHSA